MTVRVDWGFTEDGDLALGTPKISSDGLMLYKHNDGSIDTSKGADGRPIYDIALSMGSDVERQIIMNRLKTDSPDWFHHPNMGGNLSDLIGEPNTRETGERGAALIESMLVYDNLYQSNQVSVRPVPISHTELMFIITITKYRQEPYQLPVIFNLELGLLKVYGQ